MRVRFVIAAMVLALLPAQVASAARRHAPAVAWTTSLGGPTGLVGCGDAMSEAFPQAGVDPRNASRLRAVYQQGGLRAPIATASGDGGRTWTRRPLADATACAGGPRERALSSNPQVSVGARGTLWHGQSWLGGTPPDTWRFGVGAHRWNGKGRSTSGSPRSDDDAQNAPILADESDPNAATMMWTDLDQVDNPLAQYIPTGSRLMISSTADGGRSWTAPRVVYAPPDPSRLVVNGRLVRASDGALLAFFDVGDLSELPGAQIGLAPATLKLFVMRSEDDGASWSAPQQIGTPALAFVDDPDHDGNEINTPAVSSKYDVATGRRGLVAAVWREPAAAGVSSVRFALSRDDGRTWSQPRDTVAVQGESMQPAVAIDGLGGIAIFWYDFARDEPDDDRGWETDAWVALTRDRGHTWSPVRLTRAPFDLHRTNSCSSQTGLAEPLTQRCALDYDATGLGAFQDLVGLASGFGAFYTVGPPLARDGFTDALFARVVSGSR